MKRRLTPWIAVTAVLLAVDGRARAAEPTTADCLTASEASIESENASKLRAERSNLLVCAAPSCPAQIRKDCASRVDEINAQIPTVIFEGKDPSGVDISAVRVTMDGEVLAERLDGSSLEVDPGEHTFTFETAGQPSVVKRLTIQPSQKDRHESIRFETLATGLPPPPPPITSVRVEPPPANPPSAASHGMGAQKVVGITAAGLGIGGLVVGGVFGALTASAINKQKSDCPSVTNCNYAPEVSDHSMWTTDGTVSTVAFIAGGALVVGGAVLFFTARAGTEKPARAGIVVVPAVAPGAEGMLLQGWF